MAIGRIPPDFFSRAINRPPNRIGVTSGWHLPSSSELTNAVKDESKVGPDSRQLTRSKMCCGRTPSGPPEEPAGNERIDESTSASETCMAAMSTGDLAGPLSDGGSG